MNAALHEYEGFYQELDGLVVIKIGDVDWVYKYVSLSGPGYTGLRIEYSTVLYYLLTLLLTIIRWREEPEQLLREANKPAMTKDELRDFVDRYMPAYKLYLPGLYADPTASTERAARGLWSPSSKVAAIPRLVMEIDGSRQPVAKPVEFNFSSEVVASQK